MTKTNQLGAKPTIDTTDFKNGIKAMNRELRVLESGFKANAASLGNWSKTATGLELRSAALTNKLEVQKKIVAATRAEYEKVAAEKGRNSSAAQELEIKLNKETETLNRMEGELRETDESLEEMRKSSGEAAKSVDKLGDESEKSSKRMETMKGVVGGLGKAFAALAKAAAAALAAVAVGVGAMMASSTKEFIEFEKGMAEVFTLLPELTQDAMGEMSQDLREFSKEMGVLTSESVPALYQAISAGVPRENVFEFLRVAQMAAVGGVTDLETAVDGITSVVNAYGDEVLSAAEASDLMFTTVKLGKTDFSQLSAALFNVIPTASALKVNFGDVTAALAAMTAQGTPTSVATTQLRQLLVELSKEGSNTASVFEQLAGKSFDEFIASGGNLADALAILEDGAEGSGKRISDLFGSVEAGNAALALTGKGFETFVDNIQQMGDSAGATEEAFDTMEKTAARKIEKIKARFEDMKLNFGEKLAPGVAALADAALDLFENPAVQEGITRLSDFFAFLAEAVQEFASGNTQGGLAKLFGADNAASLLRFFDKIQSFVQDTLLPFIRDHSEEIKAALIGIGAALAAAGIISAIVGIVAALNPVTLIIAAIVAAVGLLSAAWAGNWGGIRDAVMQVWDGYLKPAFDTLREWLSATIPAALQTLSAFWTGTLLPALQLVWGFLNTSVFPLFQAIGKFVNSVFNLALRTMAGIWTNSLLPGLRSVWAFLNDNILPIFRTLVEFMAEKVQPVFDALARFFTNVFLPALKGVMNTVQTIINTLLKLSDIIDGLKLPGMDARLMQFGLSAGNAGGGSSSVQNESFQFFAPVIVRGDTTPGSFGARLRTKRF